MPIKEFLFQPGVDRQGSQSTSKPRWYEADNVRFQDELPESVGGWNEDDPFEMKGIGRGVHSWVDFTDNLFTCVGTSEKFYLIAGSSQVDITPDRATSIGLTNPITTASGTNVVTITDAAHGAGVDDYVTFTAVGSAVGGYATAAFTGVQDGFKIYQVLSDDTYTIIMSTNASSNATGGGTVDLKYKITSGSSSVQSGPGYGAGPYGGDDNIPTQFTFPNNAFKTFGSIDDVGFDITGSTTTFEAGDWIYPFGFTGTVGGIDTSHINNKWWPHTGGTTTTLVLSADTGYVANAITGGGGASGKFYHFDASAGVVVGATRHYGDPSELTAITALFRQVTIANFGEDLMFANRSGPIYYYDVSSKTSSGVPDPSSVAVELSTISGSSNVPVIVDTFVVSEGHGHVIALATNDIGATNQNKLLIRWSDRHNPFNWLPTASNEAGGTVLRHGSKIVGGVATRDEIVVFTDNAVYSGRYVGAPDTYGFNLITKGVGLYTSRAAVAVDNSVFFMGQNQFYVYNGKVETLPKNVSSYVFDDINVDAAEKVFCGSNALFSEVFWFYPSGDSIEPDKWVSYNYSNGVFSTGHFDMAPIIVTSDSSRSRTAWCDIGARANPIATFMKEYNPDAVPPTYTCGLVTHESGRNGFGSTISASIESGSVSIAEGDRFTFWSKLIPDVELFDINDGIAPPSVTASIIKRDLPGKAKSTESTITMTYATDGQTYTPIGNNIGVRGRGRLVAFRFSSNSVGYGWRVGTIRVNVRPDGRR
mgnify:CR=1 FL=1